MIVRNDKGELHAAHFDYLSDVEVVEEVVVEIKQQLELF